VLDSIGQSTFAEGEKAVVENEMSNSDMNEMAYVMQE